MHGPGNGGGSGPGSPAKRGSFSSPSPYRSPSRHVVYSDRYIPSRAVSSRLDYSVLEREAAGDLALPSQASTGSGSACNAAAPSGATDAGVKAYAQMLRSELLGCPPVSPERPSLGGGPAPPMAPRSPSKSPARKMFRYMAGDDQGPLVGATPAMPYTRGGSLGGDEGVYGGPSYATPLRSQRRIPRVPIKVLDAPGLSDDFYLSLLDWSPTNVIAVGLASSVYLWSASTSKVTQLVDVGPDDVITSVSWSSRGNYLAVGLGSGALQIWDAAKNVKIRDMEGHTARVTCMSWSGATLASGSRDKGILLRDPREAAPSFTRLASHRSEICGLSWAPDGRQLASGGNDNMLCVWDVRRSTGAGVAGGDAPVWAWNEHGAAVKALAWSPHTHGLLASGGGSADRSIRLWSTTRGTCLQTVDTGSQVCALAWSRNANEILSTHGYSQNQIHVWKFPGMTKLATLTGHSSRVLYLAVSPDGQTVVTGAGDETLRFWNIFPELKGKAGTPVADIGSHLRASIR